MVTIRFVDEVARVPDPVLDGWCDLTAAATRAMRDTEDGRCLGVHQFNRLLGDQAQHAGQVQRGGNGVRDALEGAQLGHLAAQTGICPAVEASVLDADRQLASDGAEKGDLLVVKLAAIHGQDIQNTHQTVPVVGNTRPHVITATAQQHRHRHLGCVDVLADRREGHEGGMSVGVRRRNRPTLRSGPPGDTVARPERDRADGGGIETDGGTKGERTGGRVVEKDGTGIAAGRLGNHPHRRLEHLRQLQVRRCRLVDSVERGQPRHLRRQGRLWGGGSVLAPVAVVGAGDRGEGNPGGEHRRRVGRMAADPLEQPLQGVDAGRHGVLQGHARPRRIPSVTGKGVAQRLRTCRLGCGVRSVRPL